MSQSGDNFGRYSVRFLMEFKISGGSNIEYNQQMLLNVFAMDL